MYVPQMTSPLRSSNQNWVWLSCSPCVLQYLAHLILLDFIVLKMLSDECKLWNPLFLHKHQWSYVSGNVHRIIAICCSERWILGNSSHDWNRIHMLLHRQDPSRVSLWGRCYHGSAGESTGLLCCHCTGMLWTSMGCKSSKHCSDHRASHDMHPVCCGLWGSHDWYLSWGIYWLPELDDACWDISCTIRSVSLAFSFVHSFKS